MMANDQKNNKGLDYIFLICFLLTCSIFLNVFFLVNQSSWPGVEDVKVELTWSKGAAAEAEAVAAVACSGHGRAYLDGLLQPSSSSSCPDKDSDILGGGSASGSSNQIPICECNLCYGGPDCSQFFPDCSADADSGDPLFLEPFWMQHAASSALLVAGWHRMSYRFQRDERFISEVLETQIRKLHGIIGNADTSGKFILFGAGSTQLVNAAIYALSPVNSSSPAGVVASIPFYPLYELQADLLKSMEFNWQGDASLWKNISSNSSMINLIEFVTSPNNPDGKLMKPVLHNQQGLTVKTIHDHAYYWPHFSAIVAPANEDLMIFTLSKLTGHAGSRFGWAFIKDEEIYERMNWYLVLSSMGVSRDAQLRALKLLKVVMKGEGREFFDFGHTATKNRWKKLNKIVSASNKRFSLQKLNSNYCTYFQRITQPSPAYAWLKCEREEDQDCFEVLKSAGIIGRGGEEFHEESRYVRLSLIKGQDDFDQLIRRMDALISQEDGAAKRI